MKTLILSLAVLLTACGQSNSHTHVLTYQELVEYPTRCDLADSQLNELQALQRTKNFDPDPDNLSEGDRAYNSRLKATIWWYAYTCNKS